MKKRLKKIFSKMAGKHYEQGRRWKKSAKVLCAIALLVCLVLCAVGIVIADRNSLEVGWGRERTELTFAVSRQRVDITVFDRKTSFGTGKIQAAGKIAVKTAGEFEKSGPSCLRISDMLLHTAKNGIKSIRIINPLDAARYIKENI